MPIEIQVRARRLLATQTGAMDWHDAESAFAMCAAWLDRDPQIGEILFDLRGARLKLNGLEADQLAELVTALFPRPVAAAIVEPQDFAGRERVVEFANKLERLGLSAAVSSSLRGAANYLRAVQCEAPVPVRPGFLTQVRFEIERVLAPADLALKS